MMRSTTELDWGPRLNRSCAAVASWLAALPAEAWLTPVAGGWTVKDLVGHLAAWSDLLLDQVEALAQGRAHEIEPVDIDSWNAAQVAARDGRPIAAVRAEWERSNRRAQALVAHLPPEAFGQRRQVAWSADPITINDLLDLLLQHLREHEEAWAGKTES